VESGVERVARLVGVRAEELREAMMKVGNPKVDNLSIPVRVPLEGWTGYHIKRTGMLWKVAEELGIEPEDLKDAILEVYRPAPGENTSLNVRRRRRTVR